MPLLRTFCTEVEDYTPQTNSASQHKGWVKTPLSVESTRKKRKNYRLTRRAVNFIKRAVFVL